MLYCFRAFLSLFLLRVNEILFFPTFFVYNTLVATRVKNRREKISNYIIFHRFESQPSPLWIEFFETGLILSRYRFAIYSRDIGTRSKFRVGRNARPFPITPANLEIVISPAPPLDTGRSRESIAANFDARVHNDLELAVDGPRARPKTRKCVKFAARVLEHRLTY